MPDTEKQLDVVSDLPFKALYGIKTHSTDVTKIIRRLFYAPTKRALFIGKGTQFNSHCGDPAPGKLKTLEISILNGESFSLREKLEETFCYHFGKNCDCKHVEYRVQIASQYMTSTYRSNLIDWDYANEYLLDKIVSGAPFCAARIGSCEVQAIEDRNRVAASQNVGISPPTDEQLSIFAKEYTEALQKSDCCLVFGRSDFEYYLDKVCPKMLLISASATCEHMNNIRFPSALGYQRFWFHALAGKKVLVVNPFKYSILRQSKKRLFKHPYPKFKSLQILQAPLTQSSGKTPYVGIPWSEHLTKMKSALASLDFDIALLGCGGYALPLGAECKRLGKQSIVLGGITQMFFGVLGKRWEQRFKDEPMIFENWIHPNETERPENWKDIEWGCYW